MIRKVLVVFCTVWLILVGNTTQIMGALGFFFCNSSCLFTLFLIKLGIGIVAMVLHFRAQPYEEEILDSLENFSLIATVCTLYCGMFFFSNEIGEVTRTIFVVCIFLLNGVFFATAAYIMYEDMKGKAAELITEANEAYHHFKGEEIEMGVAPTNVIPKALSNIIFGSKSGDHLEDSKEGTNEDTFGEGSRIEHIEREIEEYEAMLEALKESAKRRDELINQLTHQDSQRFLLLKEADPEAASDILSLLTRGGEGISFAVHEILVNVMGDQVPETENEKIVLEKKREAERAASGGKKRRESESSGRGRSKSTLTHMIAKKYTKTIINKKGEVEEVEIDDGSDEEGKYEEDSEEEEEEEGGSGMFSSFTLARRNDKEAHL